MLVKNTIFMFLKRKIIFNYQIYFLCFIIKEQKTILKNNSQIDSNESNDFQNQILMLIF